MHSFLLIGKNQLSLQKTIDALYETHGISPFDRTILSLEKSIGIEDIRNIQKNLSLTAVNSPTKAAVIYQADSMTSDAQNAFLKTLEEPPAHTIIILIATNKDSFLPTILSRCTIIEEAPTVPMVEEKTRNFFTLFFKTLHTGSIGDILRYAEMHGKNKDTAILLIEQAIIVAREQLRETEKTEWSCTIRHLQKTHVLLTRTNTNPRLALEHMMFTLKN